MLQRPFEPFKKTIVKITVNHSNVYQVEGQVLNGKSVELDSIQVGEGAFHVIRDGVGYSAEILSVDDAAKVFCIRVNGHEYTVEVQDHFDELLEKMGLNHLAAGVVSDIKAPMPGLVIEVMVEAGQSISKGDPVLILEAMKMENVLKAPADGTVQAVVVSKGSAVEKNAVLIRMG